MRSHRLMTIGTVLLLILLFASSVLAQDDSTDAESTAEATAEATQPVSEETAEATEAPAEETAEATEAPAEEPAPAGSTYTVRAGDNLFRIALRFGLSTSQLATANNIANPNLIFVGQVLTIPGDASEQPTETPDETTTPEPTETPDTPTSGDSYTVVAGDTLFRIAVRNNTTVGALLALNPDIVNQNLIFVGQEIVLPSDSDDGDTDADDDTDTEQDAEATEEAEESTDSDDAETDDTETETEEDAEAEATEQAQNASLDVEMATGVEILPDSDYASLASLTTQLGVSWVKLTADWSVIEPTQGEFDFAALDTAISTFEGNAEIILLLTGAPDWARPSSTELALQQPAYGPPDDLSTFGDFAGEVATRYAGQVAAYEIWFQPNRRITWMTTDVELRSDGFPDAGLSDVQYIDLLEVAYDAIKAADETALVLNAGLAPTGNNDQYNSIDSFIFFEALLEQGALNFTDAVNIHLDGFSNPPDATCCGDAETDPGYDESGYFFFNDLLEEYREILDANGGSELPLWVTRFGWGTTENAAGDGRGIEFVTLNTAQEQAAYTADALTIGADLGYIQAMFVYNLNGCATDDVNACYYSMIGFDGEARPIFDAVSQ